MATYYSNRIVNSDNKLTKTVVRGGIHVIEDWATFTVSTNLVTNDDIQMIRIPAGATVLDLALSCTASVGATGNLSVGDDGDTDRFITSTAHTGATFTRLNTQAGHCYEYTAANTIDILAVSIATPATGAVLRLHVIYSMANLA